MKMGIHGYVAQGTLTGEVAPQVAAVNHPPIQFYTTVGAATSGGVNTARKPEFSELLAYELEQIQEMLLSKNRKYGNAALEPVRIFSKADALEQLKVRIDDKLSRLANQQADETCTLTFS